MTPTHVLIDELCQLGEVLVGPSEHGREARLVTDGPCDDVCVIAPNVSLAIYRLWKKALGSGQAVCA